MQFNYAEAITVVLINGIQLTMVRNPLFGLVFFGLLLSVWYGAHCYELSPITRCRQLPVVDFWDSYEKLVICYELSLHEEMPKTEVEQFLKGGMRCG